MNSTKGKTLSKYARKNQNNKQREAAEKEREREETAEIEAAALGLEEKAAAAGNNGADSECRAGDESEVEESDVGRSEGEGTIGQGSDNGGSDGNRSHEEGSEMDDSDVEDSFDEDFDQSAKEMKEEMDIEDLIAMMSEEEFEQVLIDVGTKDAYTGGPPIEPEDDSSDYHTYDPYHVIDVVPYSIARPASGFEKFTLFPELPIEIRNKIWRATFHPRRHVWSYEDGTATCCKHLGLTHPPIALFVNKESREVTLKYYVKLEEHASRCEGYGRRTPYVFFNKDLDTLRTETNMAKNGNLGEFCKDHFQKPHVDILGEFRYLEIEEWAFSPPFNFPDRPEIVNLKDFKKLKELIFVPIFWCLWSDEDLEKHGDTFIKGYEDFFTKLAAEDPMRMMPKVTIAKPTPKRHSMCKWVYQK